MTELTPEQKIDEIILKPAHWQYEDYKKAKQQLLTLISDIDRQARYKELNKIARRNYCKDLGTYDFDGLAEDVLDRLSILKEKRNEKTII